MAAPAIQYDEDEKNEPVGFEQDPESDDFGDGYFTYADGTRKYASDAETAQQLSAGGKSTTGSVGADDEIQPPADPGTRVSYAGDPDSPYANAVAANEGATGSAALGNQPGAQPIPNAAPGQAPAQPLGAPGSKTNPIDLDAEEAKVKGAPAPAATSPEAPAPGAPPTGAPPTAPARTTAPPVAAPPLPLAQSTRGQTSSENASDTSGRTENSSQSRQQSVQVSRTGSAMPKAEFDASQEDLGQTYRKAMAGDQQAQGHLADIMAEHEAQMMIEGRAREAAAAAAQAQNLARQKAVTQKINDVAARPTDVNKIWKDKGALGSLLGGLGVLAGSLYATKRGGPNTALEEINRQKQDVIKAQLADRDSELRGLEKELGTIDAAVPVFEARMNAAISQRAQSMLTGEKSAQVRANLADYIGKLDVESKSRLAEGAKAYYGTVATQQSAQAGEQYSLGSSAQSTRGSQLGQEASDVSGAKSATDADKRDADQAKAAAVMTASKDLNEALGNSRDKNGNWVEGGGAKADEKTIEARRQALKNALEASGYKPDAAEDATDVGSADHPWKSTILPFYGLLKDAQAPGDIAAKSNAFEAPLRERLNTPERTASRAIPLPRVKPR